MSEIDIELSETEEKRLHEIYSHLLYKIYKLERKLARSQKTKLLKFDDWACKIPEEIHEKIYMDAFNYLDE